MIKREPNKEFVKLVNDAAKSAKIRKRRIADEIGLHQSSLTRIFSGEIGVNKPTASAILKAMNRIAGETIIDVNEALTVAGFDTEETEVEIFSLGNGAQLHLDDSFSELEKKEIVQILTIGFEIAAGRILGLGTKSGNKLQKKK